MAIDLEDLARQSNISSKLKRTKEWLSRLIFWYGMTQGMIEADNGRPNSNFFTLTWFDPSRLKYYWYFYYTTVHLVITEDENAMNRFISERGSIANFAIGGKNLNDFPVFGQNNEHLPAKIVVQIVSEIESEIEQYLPGIRAENSLRICSTPKHVWESTEILTRSDGSPFYHLLKYSLDLTGPHLPVISKYPTFACVSGIVIIARNALNDTTLKIKNLQSGAYPPDKRLS